MTVPANRQGYRGYVTSRRFGDYFVPVPVQSLALRDYCARKNKIYVLPVNENDFPHSYMVLDGMVRNLDGFEGIVMFSMFMLPQRPERRRAIYQRILDQDCSLHIVWEGIIVEKPADIERLEELLLLSSLVAQAPKTLPLTGS